MAIVALVISVFTLSLTVGHMVGLYLADRSHDD
jgi:hypothetical protein